MVLLLIAFRELSYPHAGAVEHAALGFKQRKQPAAEMVVKFVEP